MMTEIVMSNFISGIPLDNGANVLRPCPAMFIAVPGLMDSCLQKESFHGAIMYEVNTWLMMKKFVRSMSRRKMYDHARRVWSEENYPFIECYKNGEWPGHVMVGWIAGSEEKIEMIEVESGTYTERPDLRQPE